MSVKVDFKISRKLQERIAMQYGRHTLEVGVLDDAPYKRPLSKSRGLGSYAGGPVRKKSGRIRGTVAQVAEIVRKVHGVPYLTAPFQTPNSKDMQALKKAMITFFAGRSKSRSQVETALRALIRNPILKKKYGTNSSMWARVKGFNRKLFDTGQFYRSIIARVRTKPNVQK